MAQADGIVSNASGAAVRADLNNQLAAVFTNHSGATEPSTTYAYQWWADTTNGVMKLRNAANSAWITMFQLDGEWTSLALENGSAASPSIYFKDSGTDTGVYSPGTDQVGISTGGVQRVNFNGSTEVVFNDGGNDVDFRIEGDTNPDLFKIDAGTDQVQVANLNGGPLAGTRNRIINGDMRIDQRNGGGSVTVNGNFLYPVDRVLVGGVGSAGTFTAQQTSTSTASFSKALVLTTGTADASIASGDYYFPFLQKIEGFNTSDLAWGTASAQTITVSFWVRSNVTGTYPVAVRNDALNRSYVTTVTISAANTFEYKSVVIPGDTSGTWLTDNGTGIQLSIGAIAGTAAQTTAGAWAAGNYYSTSACTNWMTTTGNTFYITGVQLEAGTVATPFERRSYGQELVLCERYYETTLPAGNAFGSYNSTVGGHYAITLNTGDFYSYGDIRYRTRKRTTPTITIRNATTGSNGQLNTPGEIRNLSSSVNNPAAVSSASDISYRLNTSSATANNAFGWHHELNAEF